MISRSYIAPTWGSLPSTVPLSHSPLPQKIVLIAQRARDAGTCLLLLLEVVNLTWRQVDISVTRVKCWALIGWFQRVPEMSSGLWPMRYDVDLPPGEIKNFYSYYYGPLLELLTLLATYFYSHVFVTLQATVVPSLSAAKLHWVHDWSKDSW